MAKSGLSPREVGCGPESTAIDWGTLTSRRAAQKSIFGCADDVDAVLT